LQWHLPSRFCLFCCPLSQVNRSTMKFRMTLKTGVMFDVDSRVNWARPVRRQDSYMLLDLPWVKKRRHNQSTRHS
jgi:hypothetical protein